MRSSGIDRGSFPPKSAMLLPVVLFLHQSEEWFGGFPAWTSFAVGNGIEPERFLLLNAAGLALCAIWTIVAFRVRQTDWAVASLATLLGLNGILHAVASLLVGRYSPGTATGLFLMLPLAAVVLRASQARLTRPRLSGAILVGVLLHAVVTLLALA